MFVGQLRQVINDGYSVVICADGEGSAGRIDKLLNEQGFSFPVLATPPEIAAGASADVTVEVPAKDVVGNSIRLELVQEKVAWFSSFGVAPFDFGPFTSCDANGVATVCGADGKPLAAG